MKILHVSTHDSGGAATAAIRLHLGLLKIGMDSRMLFLKRTNANIPQSSYFYGTGRCLLVKVLYKSRIFKKLESRLGKQFRNYTELFSFSRSDYNIMKHAEYQSANIIHLHWVNGFIDYPSFFKKNRKPVVWTLHDMNPFTGLCHYSGTCEQYESLCASCPLHFSIRSIRKSHQRKISSLSEKDITIISPSSWLLSLSERSMVFKGKRHERIQYGLDLSTFKPHDRYYSRGLFNIPVDKTIFLFVSDNLSTERKGFKLLLEAVKMLSDETDIGFYAVGYSEVPVDGINYLGKVQDERLMALLYSAADAFILPSLEDNLPNTMLESLSCGTPVISFDAGGIGDVVINQETGLICKSTTSLALLNGIRTFIQNPDVWDRDELRQFAVHHFDLQDQALKNIDIYQELVS